MKTFKNFIKEEFIGSMQVSGGNVDIYKNPSKVDISNLKNTGAKEICVIITGKGNVFFWDGKIDCTEVVEEIMHKNPNMNISAVFNYDVPTNKFSLDHKARTPMNQTMMLKIRDQIRNAFGADINFSEAPKRVDNNYDEDQAA